MDNMNPLLKASGLAFAYSLGNDKELSLFRGLDLSVESGEIICILGPSGSGKSTLLKILSGFLSPQEGSVHFGKSRVESPFKQGQVIFQDPNQLLPWLTVAENILFPHSRRSLFKKPDSTPLLKELLHLTGLTDFAHYFPAQLSGGMKQRCSLARAFYAQPQILFMDEPFVSLDAPSRSALQKVLIESWKTRKPAILFVTHDISEALLLADRIVILTERGGNLLIKENNLTRPRSRQDRSFLAEELRLYSVLESSGLSL